LGRLTKQSRSTERCALGSGKLASMIEQSTMSRGRFVALGGGALAGLVGARAPSALGARTVVGARSARRGYVSRPDLKPPDIEVSIAAAGTARGAIFLAPFEITTVSGTTPPVRASESHSGPLVVDNQGEPLWFLPLATKTAMDFRMQKFRGRPVVTWYQGTVLGPYGGEFVVFDPTYHQIARVTAGNGRHGDLHEFLLTSKGTALITIYNEVTADLTSIGGARDGRLVTGIVQEVNVASGDVLFEWRSREHVGLDESFMTGLTPAGNVDYFHLNSIGVDRDGHFLVSARHTSAVYKVNRRTGKVIWRLGGKHSDFAVDHDASFSFQHDVRRHRDGTLTIFDNNGSLPGSGTASRAIRLALDMKRRRGSLVREYVPVDARDGWAMGNAQLLEDGGIFVGWGTAGSFSEFGPDGRVRYDARFADESVTYRAFRCSWVARPTGQPALAVAPNGDGTVTAYASWNGATEVARWSVETGESPDRLRQVATQNRAGFETAITVPATHGYVSVVALDGRGKRLGAATPVTVQV
jgi:hypothetical protein